MKRNIGFRMTLAFLAVAIGTIALAGILIRSGVRSQFSGYLQRSIAERDRRIVAQIEEAYAADGDWSFLPSLWHYAARNAVDIEVLDANGRRIFIGVRQTPFGRGHMQGPPLRGAAKSYLLSVRRQKIGEVRITHLGPEGFLSAQDNMFRASVNASILRAMLLSAAVAVLLAAFFTGQIVRPLKNMTVAANRLAAGELGTVVPADSGDELAELGTAMNIMSSRLLRLEKLRQRLTQDIAHELRTPLASAKGLAEGIADGVVPADAEHLASLLEEVDRLSGLVNALADLSRAEAARHHLSLSPQDPMAIARKSAHRLAGSFHEKGVALEVGQGAQAIPLDVPAMERVFDNLLHNALRHTPSGGRVSIRQTVGEAFSEIDVEDTGSGIEAEHLPYIFERFYRADPSRSRATGGTGIGLAIVRELVEAQGGLVRAESVLGKGARFILRFPLA